MRPPGRLVAPESARKPDHREGEAPVGRKHLAEAPPLAAGRRSRCHTRSRRSPSSASREPDTLRANSRGGNRRHSMGDACRRGCTGMFRRKGLGCCIESCAGMGHSADKLERCQMCARRSAQRSCDRKRSPRPHVLPILHADPMPKSTPLPAIPPQCTSYALDDTPHKTDAGGSDKIRS